MSLIIHHDKIKDQVALISSYHVEFDSDGNGTMEDDDCAKAICKDGLGFTLVELVDDKKDEKKAIKRQPAK